MEEQSTDGLKSPSDFIEEKREYCDHLNECEFPVSTGECSRTSAHTVSVKSLIVDNQEGILSRYTSASKTMQSDQVDERLRNLEQLLAIPPSPHYPSDIYARLKTLEDKIMKLEELYPQIAVHLLNYEDAVDTRLGGRVTKAPGFYRELRMSKKKRRNAPGIAPIGISAEAAQASDIIKSRMEDLRKKILK